MLKKTMSLVSPHQTSEEIGILEAVQKNEMWFYNIFKYIKSGNLKSLTVVFQIFSFLGVP